MKADVTLQAIYFNTGVGKFFFREQAYKELENLVKAVGVGSEAFDELEEAIESCYENIDDFEEDCYNLQLEELLQILGYSSDDDEDDGDEDIDGVGGVRVDNEWGANEMYVWVMNNESLYNKYRDYLFNHANTMYYKEYIKKYARMLQKDIKYGRIVLQPGMGHGEQARMMAAEDLYNVFSSQWLNSQVK